MQMAAVFTLVSASVWAAVWTTSGFADLPGQLERTEFDGVSVLPSGRIALASALVRLCSLEEATVWRAMSGRRGVYVATGPDARLLRVGADGRVQTVFSGGSGEILALAGDSRGAVWFGTTPGGSIYRVTGGEATLVCSTGCTYVFSLLPSPDGSILCGTGDKGQLLRITPAGTSEVVFSATQAHVSALAWLIPGRELLVGTTPCGLVYRLSLRQGQPSPKVAVLYDTPLDEVRSIVCAGSLVFVGGNPADGSQTDSAAVLAIDTTGVCLWRWGCPDSSVFDLAADGERILVATGNRGLVYGLNREGRTELVHRLREPLALCLAPGHDGWFVGTGNPARLYRLGPGNADSGHIAPPPYDCTNPARFGRFASRVKAPAGTGISFETRSGNSGVPDSSWSPWTCASDRVVSPPARFLQWRAKLWTRFPDRTPELERVDVWFEPANLAPVVSAVVVGGPTDNEVLQGVAKPRRDITWTAADPESDSLVYDVFLKAETETRWLHIGKDLAEPRLELDTRALPDDWFEVKVVASDRAERSADAALAGERISPVFLVDNTPPRVSGITVRNGKAAFTVTDELSAIRACRVAVNAGNWKPALPLDGMFDSPEEKFSVTVELEPGANTIAVWAVDAQGNVGAGRLSLR